MDDMSKIRDSLEKGMAAVFIASLTVLIIWLIGWIVVLILLALGKI